MRAILNHFAEIAEILQAPYSGEHFPGYENICHDFHVLEPIFKLERSDWKAALSSVKGIYLISDKHNDIGSAYGYFGIWSRWSCYIGTGHGWNDELTKLINEKGIEHARENFLCLKSCLYPHLTMLLSQENHIGRTLC